MVKALETMYPKVSETGSIIQESLEKVAKVLEMERNKLRDRAEQDSNQVIARAKEEADKIITQARQKAEVESDKLIAKLKEEANQILRESREKASTEARQESARIIGETREKTAQIIKEVIEQGVIQAKSEFIRAASEARSRLESEKSKLLTVTKSIEKVIDETEINIQAGSEHLSASISEIERKLVNEIPRRETVMTSRQVAEEARKTEFIEKQVNEQVAGEQVRVKTNEVKKTEGSEDADIRMREGMVLLDSGKNKEALEAFVKVLELDPKNALAWRKKGAALGILGRHQEALEAFRRAIALDPKDIISWHNKVISLTKLGNKKEADEAKEAEKRVKKEVERAAKL
jgi:tetratricopeptide (TPR) repeat protein